MSNKYAVTAAKYEVMSEVLEYLESKIADSEGDLERAKKRLEEVNEGDYTSYLVDRVDEYAIKTEAYKTVQSMFIEYFD